MKTSDVEDCRVLAGIFFKNNDRLVELTATAAACPEAGYQDADAIGIHRKGDLRIHPFVSALTGIISFAPLASIAGFRVHSFHYINNPDGSVRWLYPWGSRKPRFLKLYNGSGWRGWIFRTVFHTGFSLGADRLLKSGTVHIYYKRSALLDDLLYETPRDDFAIFTGTVGDNRKAVIALTGAGKREWFYKLPLSANGSELVRHEAASLEHLRQMRFEHIHFPEAKRVGTGVLLSDVRPARYRNSYSLQPIHHAALWEMYEQTHELYRYSNLPCFEEIDRNLASINMQAICNDLPHETVARLDEGLNRLRSELDAGAIVPTVIGHGDFTPWNMYPGDSKLHVYDWELSERLPLLYDAFHFIFQSGILVKRLPFENILQQVEALRHHPDVKLMLEDKPVGFDWLYRFYLLRNVSYYLSRYIRQQPLHAQAHWLVNTWAEAVEEVEIAKLLNC